MKTNPIEGTQAMQQTRIARLTILTLLSWAAAHCARAAPTPPARFTDVTDEVGGLSGYTIVHPYTAPHAAWGDYDNDGWVDICQGWSIKHGAKLTQLCGVWRNVEGKKFELTAKLPEGCLAAIWGDYDNDGYLDLYDWSSGRLFRNQTGKAFKEVAMPEGGPEVSRGACWGDWDSDGWLDLYVGGFEIWGQAEYPDVIFQNMQGRGFKLTWQQKGILRARGITAADFDEDGDLDIYVTNYRLQPNLLWINDGQGRFTNRAEDYGVVAAGHGIGSAWGDFDSDGHIDLFAGNFSHPGQPPTQLLRNPGPIAGRSFRFEHMTTATPRWQESFASPALGDFDNDGFLDFYFTTVYEGGQSVLYQNTSADFGEIDTPYEKRTGSKSPVGEWHFRDVTAQAGVSTASTYGAAWADYDNDGDLDLAAGARLFRNPGNDNHWLKLRLEGGRGMNRGAIGTRVLVTAGPWTIARQVEGATGAGNQNDLALHFGLGRRGEPVRVVVHWPDKSVQTLTTRVDRIVVVNRKGRVRVGD